MTVRLWSVDIGVGTLMYIILVYVISDDMCQANNSYEWFLHHIMDNTI